MLCGAMDDPRFIRANTKLLPVPLVPEIRLHLAEESLPIWQQDRGGAGADERAAALLGVRLGRRAGAGALSARQPGPGRRPSVLDLGAGSGLAAIAAMKAGAARVLAADIDALALAAIGLNAEANGVAVETTAADLLAGAPGRFDVVLVGDLFYERPLAERVLAFVEAARARRRGGAGRRSAAQLLPAGTLPQARRIFGARDARPGGHGDQAHRGLAARSRAGGPRRTGLRYTVLGPSKNGCKAPAVARGSTGSPLGGGPPPRLPPEPVEGRLQGTGGGPSFDKLTTGWRFASAHSAFVLSLSKDGHMRSVSLVTGSSSGYGFWQALAARPSRGE